MGLSARSIALLAALLFAVAAASASRFPARDFVVGTPAFLPSPRLLLNLANL
jgi:hypothetical protein